MTDYLTKNYTPELTTKLLKLWQEDCETLQQKTKEKFESKVQWFKDNWMVEKTDQKLPNRNQENNKRSNSNQNIISKRSSRKNLAVAQKFNSKDTKNQPKEDLSDIDSVPSDETLVEVLQAISNNNFDNEMKNTVLQNSQISSDGKDHHFLSKTPSH